MPFLTPSSHYSPSGPTFFGPAELPPFFRIRGTRIPSKTLCVVSDQQSKGPGIEPCKGPVPCRISGAIKSPQMTRTRDPNVLWAAPYKSFWRKTDNLNEARDKKTTWVRPLSPVEDDTMTSHQLCFSVLLTILPTSFCCLFLNAFLSIRLLIFILFIPRYFKWTISPNMWLSHSAV